MLILINGLLLNYYIFIERLIINYEITLQKPLIMAPISFLASFNSLAFI